jgi:predicted secreted protein
MASGADCSQLGRLLRLEIEDTPGVFLQITGQQTTTLDVTRGTIDISARDCGWRTALGGGAATVELRAAGIIRKGRALSLLKQAAYAGAPFRARLLDQAGLVARCLCFVLGFTRSAQAHDAEHWSVTLEASGAVEHGADEVAVDTGDPVAPLVDASAWIGYWNAEDPAIPNVIAQGAGGAADRSGYTGYTLTPRNAGGPTGVWCCGHPPGGSYERGALFPQRQIAQLSLGGWLRQSSPTVGPPHIRIWRATDDPFMACSLVPYLDAVYLNGVAYAVPGLRSNDIAWHHYLLTLDSTTGAVAVYRDGVRFAAFTETTAGQGARLAPIGAWIGNDSIAETAGESDGWFLYAGILSPAAIAALAQGAEPAADGTLAAVPLADPAAWLGAWNWDDGVGANLITLPSARGGTLNQTLGVDAVAVLAPIDSGVGYAGSAAPTAVPSPVVGDYQQRSSPIFADTTSDTWTIALWWKSSGGSEPSVAQLIFDLNGALVGYLQPRQIIFAGTVHVLPAAFNHPTIGSFVALVFQHGRATWYCDGVLVDTWTTAATSFACDCVYYEAQTASNLAALGYAGGWVDQIAITTAVLSPTAIAALAAGNLPGADGMLRATLLADATRWLGAWDVTGGSTANAIAGSAGSALDASVSSLAPLISDHLELRPVAGATGRAATFAGGLSATRYTLAFSYRSVVPYGFPIAMVGATYVPGNTANLTHVDCGGSVDTTLVAGLAYGEDVVAAGVKPADGDWHAVAVVCDHEAQRLALYLDGTLRAVLASVYAGTRTLNGCYVYAYANQACDVRHLLVYHGALTPMAVAALAAGRLPDTNGRLL